MGQDVCLITSHHEDQRYLTYVLNSLGVDQLAEQKVGSTFSRVNISQIVELEIPRPSAEVQAKVADQLAASEAKHEAAARALASQIELLIERRSVIISAAVTGEVLPLGLAT